MRILRVTQKLYPDIKGGGPYHAHALSRDQSDLGHDVTVLTVRHDPALPHVEQRDGYTIIRYDPLISPLGNDISPGIAEYLRTAKDFDIIHAHSHNYFSTNLAALGRVFGETPLAITNHGIYPQAVSKRKSRPYLQTLGKWTLNCADVVFCYTKTDQRRLRDFGVSSHIEVVPNGVDTDLFSPEGSQLEQIDAGGPVLLFVGRFVDGKRPDDAIKTLSYVQQKYPEAVLYLCGSGPLRGHLEDLSSKLNMSNSIRFLGEVPYLRMPEVYRSSDILVLPSRAEGVPRAVLEAQSCGLPVVVSELPQYQEVLSASYRSAPIGATRWIGTAVVELLEAEYTHSKCTNSWETTVQKTTKVLSSLGNS